MPQQLSLSLLHLAGPERPPCATLLEDVCSLHVLSEPARAQSLLDHFHLLTIFFSFISIRYDDNMPSRKVQNHFVFPVLRIK